MMQADTAAAHWEHELRGAPALADLPTDRPRSPHRLTAHRPRFRVTTPWERTEPDLVAAVAALALRYCGQDELLIARPGPGGNGWKVLRCAPTTPTTWTELRSHVEALEARDHLEGDLPATAIAASCQPRLPAAHIAVLSDAVPPDGHDLFDLTVGRDDGHLVVDADAELFDRSTVERFVGHLTRLAAAAHDAPDAAIESLAIMSNAERSTLLDDWNRTEVPFQSTATVHELISAQALRTPGADAVVFGDCRLTYGALDARANQLAHHLVRRGVVRGDLVGVYLERSVEMVVALVAIMKCGAAYVPLDPNFPADRLAMMIEDSAIAAQVTETSLVDRLEVPTSVRQVLVDRDADTIANEPTVDPGVEISSRDLVYVIFTSGSTGRPKGVMLEHRSVVNFLETMAREPGLVAADRLLAVTTLSFDIAGLELFLPLVVGACVVVAPRSVAIDPIALRHTLADQRITVMQATPATWRMLVESGWDGDATLKALCGGEALPQSLAEALSSRVGEAWNMYGPTETTIWSTVQRVVPGAPVSIGRAIANTTLYVLDARFEPVPIGVAGELLIGGDGLARGYLGLEEMTADRFVPDPFAAPSSDPTAPPPRLYRTGDLVRYRSDGRIEFIGRIDHQVKVRGFRIELGEIETVLGRNPAIEEAIVAARSDPSGDTRLVAYVTARSGAPVPSSSAIRNDLKDALPAYMIPSLVVVLPEMPRTPNGKTDRKAMPDPDWNSAERSTPYVAPRDETERRMVALWESQLDIAEIGVHDDFFELGVESIVAARLFARIESEFGVEMPLGTVFANPTVEALSRIVSGEVEHRTTEKSLVPIYTDGSETPVFGVHGGAGTVLLFSEFARRLRADDRPFYGLQAQGLYGHDPVHTTVEQMAEAYLPQIRAVQPHGPYIIAGYCFGALVAYDIAQRLVAAGEQIQLLVSINGPSPAYIRTYDPGGLLDRAEAAATKRKQKGTFGRLRNSVRYRFLMAQLWSSILLRRPLPESLREGYFLQRLSIRAQFRYEPKPLDVPMAVFAAEGIYHEPDLGWNALVRDPVTTYTVPGTHRSGRNSMAEPKVAFVADEFIALAHRSTAEARS